MKFVIAPDSYKGSLTAPEVCRIMTAAIMDEMPSSEVWSVPLADGGEGTVATIIRATGGTTMPVTITGPLGLPAQSFIGVMKEDGSEVTVLECANLFGLGAIAANERNPMKTTSRGMADALLHAIELGCRRFVIGLGGSATNDGGMGLLAGLGVRFLNKEGLALFGYGSDLAEVSDMDWSGLDPRLSECLIEAATDVTNPLLGHFGATHVFGPQKGATPFQINALEVAMSHYADLMERSTGCKFRDTPGAGAAGGLGFALLMLGAKLKPGAQIVERLTGLRAAVANADWIFTGEGQTDGQTLFGKLPLHVASIASEYGKPITLVSGSLGPGYEQLATRFAGCFSIANGPSTLEQCIEQAEVLLYGRTRQILSLIRRTAKGND